VENIFIIKRGILFVALQFFTALALKLTIVGLAPDQPNPTLCRESFPKLNINIFHCKTLQNLPKFKFWFENIPSANTEFDKNSPNSEISPTLSTQPCSYC
jgi:hypothetical protein